MRYKWSFFLFVVLLQISCNDSDEYRVNAEFEPYIFIFEKEAAARGVQLNLKSEGLIVEFANLKDDQAGLCHYENPIRIEIDQDYWNKISLAFDEEMLKENLIFHELGHGILNRRHSNQVLENGDWKSIMCGGNKVDNRSWNINYYGKRRNYYLDELFNESTSIPEFLTLSLNTDTTGFQYIVNLNFNSENKADTGWDLKTTANYSTSTENKQLKVSSFTNYSQALLLSVANTALNSSKDFLVEMDIDVTQSESVQQYGILIAYDSEQNDTTEYFKINRNQYMYPGNSLFFGYFSQLPVNYIQKTGFNKLKIIKINNTLFYFINNQYVYQTESYAFGTQRFYGFVIPPKSIVYIDNYRIGIRNSSNIKLKSKSNLSYSDKVIQLKDDVRTYNK